MTLLAWLKKIPATIWLALAGIMAYANSWFNPFIWDDEQFIFKNQYVLEFDLPNLLTQSITHGAGIVSNYYRPLTSVSFAIDHAIWGLRPFGFHLTNTWLHIASGLLLFWLLKKLFSLWQVKTGAWPPFILSLLFLIHPLQTEAVTYINSRGDSLFTFWLMLALVLFAHSFGRKEEELTIGSAEVWFPNWLQLSCVVICFIFSIFSKEIGLAGAGLVWLIGLSVVWQRIWSLGWRKTLQEIWPQLVTLAAVAAVVGLYLLGRATIWNFSNSFDFYDGQGIYAQSLLVRMLTFSQIFFVYLRLLIVPFPLHMERTIELVTSLVSPWPWLLLATAGTIFWAGWREWRLHTSTVIWFGAGWMAAMLAPTSGIIPINGLLYEHWLYVPLVGFFLMTWRIGWLWQKTIPNWAGWLGGGWLVILLVLTWRQNYIWGDHIRFYTYTLQFNQTARVHNNLAMAFVDANELELAETEYRNALSLAPYPQTHYNLGNLLAQQNQVEAALEQYVAAVQLAPGFSLAHRNVAAALYVLGEESAANRVATASSARLPALLESLPRTATLSASRQVQPVN